MARLVLIGTFLWRCLSVGDVEEINVGLDTALAKARPRGLKLWLDRKCTGALLPSLP